MNNTVLVVMETNEAGEIVPASLEALAAARKVATDSGCSLAAALVGNQVSAAAEQLQAYLPGSIYVTEDESLAGCPAEPTARALESIMTQAEAGLVIFAHTLTAIDLAPRVAAACEAGLIMDCVRMEVENGEVLYTKPVFSSNVMAVYGCDTLPALVTMRARAAEPAEPLDSAAGKIETVALDLGAAAQTMEVLDRTREEGEGVDLSKADVIVAGGRGLGGPEGFDLLRELAQAMNGAVGASRPPCDLEWVSPKLQVGLTGEIVAPALYVAVGISGSFQHLAGITDSKVIVAVNRDEKAYIFKVADYGVVGDYEEVIPAFLEAVSKNA